MSRHGRTVPVEFYHRFTRDACALAERIAGGRIISVLEGTCWFLLKKSMGVADRFGQGDTATGHLSAAPLPTLRGSLMWKLISPVIGGR